MSFGKLKSARKAREVHSFVKPGSTPSSTGADASQSTHLSRADNAATCPTASSFQDDGHDPYTPSDALTSNNETTVQGISLAPDGKSQSLARTEAIDLPSSPVSVEARDTTKRVGLHGCHASWLPSSLEIRESNNHGRGLYTKTAQVAGSIIFSMTPHVSVLSTGNLSHYCSACSGFASTTGLKRCPKCKIVHYCNSNCQNRDWVWHKRECAALQKWAASAPSSDVSIPSEPVRCLGRILWGSQKEGLDSVWAKQIRMMHSNRNSLQPSSFESHTHLAHSLVRYLSVTSPQGLAPYGLTSAGDLVDLISRFTTNTFTLTTPALTPIGICVSPAVALVNHSCDPNAVIVFPRVDSASPTEEPMLHLVALRNIAPGKEVRISYVDTTLPRALRQKELKEVYSFVCQCKTCTRALPADPREALWCPKRCGGICPYPPQEDPDSATRCVKCHTIVGDADAVLDALCVGQEALDKASSLQLTDPAKARQLTTNIMPILASAGLTPSSHPLLAMTRLHQELLIDTLLSPSLTQETLDEAIRTAAKYSSGIPALLPKGHPVRVVALGELGKLLAVDEPTPTPASDAAVNGRFPPSGPSRLKLAYESLVKAHEELLIGLGKRVGGGQLGKEIRDAIVRLEKELGVWTTGIRNVLEDTPVAGRGKSGATP
ncbi:SET domain-containing protein [Ganoderma leucocontextum]|nr:SET domain-containing protein [Ganoderma leucocontextum]